MPPLLKKQDLTFSKEFFCFWYYLLCFCFFFPLNYFNFYCKPFFFNTYFFYYIFFFLKRVLLFNSFFLITRPLLKLIFSYVFSFKVFNSLLFFVIIYFLSFFSLFFYLIKFLFIFKFNFFYLRLLKSLKSSFSFSLFFFFQFIKLWFIYSKYSNWFFLRWINKTNFYIFHIFIHLHFFSVSCRFLFNDLLKILNYCRNHGFFLRFNLFFFIFKKILYLLDFIISFISFEHKFSFK